MTPKPLRPIAIDVQKVLHGVGEELRKEMMPQSVSLHSYLITRPTGRAVRMAIETQLPGAGRMSLSLIDFSEVTLIDFSCADEVVAKLLQQYVDEQPPDAFFVFKGVQEGQWDQILTVLERQGLAAVVENGEGDFSLMGVRTDAEAEVWGRIEERGSVEPEDVEKIVGEAEERTALESLLARGLAYRSESGRLHALSQLVHQLM